MTAELPVREGNKLKLRKSAFLSPPDQVMPLPKVRGNLKVEFVFEV